MKRLFTGSVPVGASIRDRKTAALGNKLILSLAGFTLFFLIVDEVFLLVGLSTDRRLFILDAVFLAFYVLSWFFHRRGDFRTGKILFILSGNFHIGILVLFFGPNSAAQWYCLLTFLLPMMLFSVREKKFIFFFMALSAAVALATEYFFLDHGALLPLTPSDEKILYKLNSLFVFLLVSSCVYYFFRATNDAEALLEEEQRRSETLLLNVLPPQVAARLKEKEGVIADQFDSVTVLFSDIVGFTKFTQTVSPAELVRILNELFVRFDELSKTHGLEKIKTIGDAYMVVGGIPEALPDHAEKVAAMALGMQAAVATWNQTLGIDLQLRIGIHSGPVVAGVIGKQKFSYDLWGDTVNTASRMESHGAPGEIHLSDTAARLLEHTYDLTARGQIEVKGKGAMTTYFLGAAK